MTQDQTKPISIQGPMCPVPHHHTETVVIGHGSGGQMTSDLVKNNFQSRIGNVYLSDGNDAARLFIDGLDGQIAVSTDSHVVSPIFYPGGDIGRLSVCGTVNDVAMLGADPKYLTAGFILEEGFSIESLNRIIDSMADACKEAGVQIVAGDTKVVERGKADDIFINTTGFGSSRTNAKSAGNLLNRVMRSSSLDLWEIMALPFSRLAENLVLNQTSLQTLPH